MHTNSHLWKLFTHFSGSNSYISPPIFPFCLLSSSLAHVLLAVRGKWLIFLWKNSLSNVWPLNWCHLASGDWRCWVPPPHTHTRNACGKGEKGTFRSTQSHNFPLFSNRKSGEIIILEALYKQGCKCVFQSQGGLSCLVSHMPKSAPAHCCMTAHGHSEGWSGVIFTG